MITVDGTAFYFDLDNLELIKSRMWSKDKDGYLINRYFFDGQMRYARFHRLIMNAGTEQFVDHINKNRADNRKSNLRLCNKDENNRNRGLYSTNHSGITGVHFDYKRNKWTASITYMSRKIFIGRFNEKSDAVDARIRKEIELFGSFAPQANLLLEVKE